MGQRPHPTTPFKPFLKEEVERSIPDRFEQQVSRCADRLAVRTGRDQLTYGALDQHANRVARAIVAQRGAAETPVVLLLETGSRLIAAILGTLKADRPYVVLDPSYPPARNRYVLEDSQGGLLISDNKNAERARELAGDGFPVLLAEEVESHFSSDAPGLSISPGTVACLLYTSGTTGQPKGVMQTHRNVLHNIMQWTNAAHLGSGDRISLLHSCSFAASITDMFGALLNGAALFPFDVQADGPNRLAQWLLQEQITVYFSGPTLFRHLVEALESLRSRGQEPGVPGREAADLAPDPWPLTPLTFDIPHLRLIRLGGEPILRREVELYRSFFLPHCLLCVSLATTETHAIRHFFMDHQTEFAGSAAPVGYPVEDMEILLLDESGQAAGPGAAGEIAVKSRYLSPGYWQKPEVTRAAFVPDPAGGPERIYRTGDLGRMLPDGCLFHLGRKDSQVKIRGHRIELAEIELALLEHPSIQDAAVAAQDNPSAEKSLVAYVVPRDDTSLAPELRQHLRERLPEHMVPSTFVTLTALPLTTSGKVDRRALPAPDWNRPERTSVFVAPRNSVEGSLAAIWAEVLGLEKVGIDDDFFDLGGHSLLAMQVVARVRSVFQADLPLRCLFETPTLAGLATAVVTRMAAATAADVAPWQSASPRVMIEGDPPGRTEG